MFNIGTRVVVLASSIKKGFGPKRGSIGYVSSQSQSSFADRIYPHSLLSFISTPMTIAFSRYGFEKKRRCELRSVVNILPAFMGEVKNVDKAREVKDVINLFQNGEFEKNRQWTEWVSDVHKMRSPQLVTLAPVGGLKVESMLEQPMETQACMESFLRNRIIGSLLHNNKHSNFYPQIGKNFMAEIPIAHRNRGAAQEILKWAEVNPKEALTYVRILSTVYNLRKGQQELYHFKALIERNSYSNGKSAGYSHFNFSAFFNLYILGFFEENKMREEEVIAKKSKSAQIHDIVRSMRYVRSAITELASKTIAKE